MASVGTRLYRGELNIDFVGNAKRWYIASAVVLLICLASMGLRGFNFGIEFEGGNSFQLPGSEQQLVAVEAAVEDLGVEAVSAQVVGGDGLLLRTAAVDNATSTEVAQAVARAADVDPADVSESAISARWGGDITEKALQALIVFLVAVVVFIAIRFQPKMAVAAVVALLHDLVTTAGVYSLVGFEVTPSTVIGLLTILGFSLYDTVVVFDKVDENTRGILGGSRTTYSAAANLAVNQTLMRSINTSLIALLPVAGLLFVGAGLLGAGTLKDLALVLFVGLATGAYSSIFLATPLLCEMKEREPAYAALRKRVEARKASGRGVDVAVAGPARTPPKRAAKATAPKSSAKPAAAPSLTKPARGSTATTLADPVDAAEETVDAPAPQPSARRRVRAAAPEATVEADAVVEPAEEADDTAAADATASTPAAAPVRRTGATAANRRTRPAAKRGRPSGKRKR